MAKRLIPSIGVRLPDPDAERVRRNLDERVTELQITALSTWAAHTNYRGRQVFTSSGTYTPTPGTLAVLLRMVGGGGGGGGGAGGGGSAAGAGGGAGAYVEQYIKTTGGVTGGAVTIGAGGTAGSNAGGNGGTGGDTSVVISGRTYTAKGGTGGGGMASIALGETSPGATAAGSSGDVWGGGRGTHGFVVGGGIFPGDGASSPWGLGGTGSHGAIGVGVAGSGYGAGGGGAVAAAAGQVGGAGSGGAVVIEEFGP